MAKLTKKQVISRLQMTLDKLKELPSRNFKYENYVSKSKELKDGSTCGTVCCVAGWYPAWFPKAGLIWAEHTLKSKSCSNYYSYDSDAITKNLANYHGISEDLVNVLFYGRIEYFESNKKFIDGYHIGIKKDVHEVTKNDIIELFEFVLELIKNNQINYKL